MALARRGVLTGTARKKQQLIFVTVRAGEKLIGDHA